MLPTESGLIILSSDEQRALVNAAQHLRETGDMLVDLTQPICLDELMFLKVAQAAIDGDDELLDAVIATLQERIRCLNYPH